MSALARIFQVAKHNGPSPTDLGNCFEEIRNANRKGLALANIPCAATDPRTQETRIIVNGCYRDLELLELS